MEDNKRELANQALGDTLGAGILSLENAVPENYVTIPSPITDASTADPGNVVNNFNLNVNVAGGGGAGRNIETKAKSVVQNALSSTSPETIKKNSGREHYDTSGNYISHFNYLERENEKTKFEARSDMSFSNASSSKPFNALKLETFTTPTQGNYTYNQSSLKDRNPQVAERYEVLKNISNVSMNMQSNISNMSPQSSIDKTTNTTIQGGNVMIDNSTMNQSTNMQSNISNMSPQSSIDKPTNTAIQGGNVTIDNSTMNQSTTQNLNQLLPQTASASRPESNRDYERIEHMAAADNLQQIQEEDFIEATTPLFQDTEMGSYTAKNQPREIDHLNEVPDPHYFFANKNNPPSWRVVIG